MLEKHDEHGCFVNLVNELKCEDLSSYKNFLRMTPENFEEILAQITPKIQKQDTKFHAAIPPAERLAVTLRFLATGIFI